MSESKTNYIPGSMSFWEGLAGPKWDVGFRMKFDQEKAKQIIQTILQSGKQIEYVTAGLDGDYEVNSCVIYDTSGFFEYNCYESSCWAQPIIIVHFKDGNSECYETWSKQQK